MHLSLLPRGPLLAAGLILALATFAMAACTDSDGGGDAAPTSPPAIAPSAPPATAAPAAAPPTAAPAPDRYGGILRVAQARDPASCDLAMSGGISYQAVHPCNPMLSQIVRIDPADHGDILPDLSERWDLSSDGATWTFKVRADAEWHDGSPVTAADLEFSLDRVIDPPEGLTVGRAGPIAGYVSGAEQTTTPDATTLRVTTDFPAASFLYNLASVYVSVFPAAATAGLDPPTMTAFGDIVGSGPFTAGSAVRGSVYKLERNDRYYEPGLPYLDGVSYFVMPEPAVRTAALKAHEIDVIMIVTEDEAVDLEDNFAGRINVTRQPSLGGNTVQMNTTRAPFDDPAVRRAVNLAINRDDARLALGGGFDGAIMPPGSAWALDDEAVAALPGYGDAEISRAEARRLLAAAGHTDGLDVKMYSRSDPFSTTLAAFAVEQLKTVGIRAELVPEERTAYQDRITRGDFALIAHSHSFALDDPDSILPAHYSCDGAENYPRYCDPEIDSLIDLQARELDTGKRREIIAEIQRRVWDADAKVWFNWSVRRTPVWSNVLDLYLGGPSLYQGRRLEIVWLER